MWSSCTLLLLAGSLAPPVTAAGAPVFKHTWDTVADLMGMHGQGGSSTPAAIDFAADHYGMITTAAPCKADKEGSTIEDGTLAVARRLKAANPATLVGMYWRTDFVGEIATCSNFTAELKATGESLFLRDDHGDLVLEHGHSVMWDYENPGVALFARALVNVVNQTLSSGEPVLDYLFLDGPDFQPLPNISAARNARLRAAKMAFFAGLQSQFDALPGGPRGAILNGVDDLETAQTFNPTGASGVMVDHWTILQFLITGEPMDTDKCNVKPPDVCGDFNLTAMDTLFSLVRSPVLSNMTLQVKGWVGPTISQPGKWPPQLHTPAPGAERQRAMAERFNSELALFLLVAEDHMWWLYSWFWSFDSFVPGQPDSDVPAGFFPQAKCALGPPKGPPARKAGTWTYTREYEHASVFVDLTNRTACRVDFAGGC